MSDCPFLTEDDAELVERRFSIENPAELENLVEILPENWRDAEVEYEYDFRGSKRDRVRCAHPGRHPHSYGGVLKTPNDVRFLVGWRCGEKHHGLDFRRIRDEFDAKRDRAALLSVLNRASPSISPAMTDFRHALEHQSLIALEEMRVAIRKVCAEKYLTLLGVADRDGVLMRGERVRDLDAEQRESSDGPKYRYVETPIGTLSGRAFISHPALPKTDLLEAQADIRKAFHILGGRSGHGSKTLHEALRSLRNAVLKGMRARAALQAPTLFYTSDNVRLVGLALDIEVDSRSLVRGSNVAGLAPGYDPPVMPGLRKLEEALRGTSPRAAGRPPASP